MVFDSVYEMFDPLTTVRKQRFWDWFSGDDVHSRWDKVNLSGTPTFSMENSTDGGLKITTGSTSNNGGSIDFNDIRPFAHNGSEIIAVIKNNSTSSSTGLLALANNGGLNPQFAAIGQDTLDYSSTLFAVGSMDTSFSTTNSTVSLDTNFHSFKLALNGVDIKGYIDGVLEVTKTTNRPSVKLQPHFQIRTRTSSVKSGQIRYLEAYNT